MKSDLGSEPIVPERAVSACRIGLRKKRGCVPTQLNVTKQSEFQKAIAGGRANAFLRPRAIQTVLQFQDTKLRNMRWIRDCWSVRICGDRICVAACLLAHPLTDRRVGCHKTP